MSSNCTLCRPRQRRVPVSAICRSRQKQRSFGGAPSFLTVLVTHDEAGVVRLVDHPQRWEAAD